MCLILFYTDLSGLPDIAPNDYYNFSSLILTRRPFHLNSEYVSTS